MSRSLGSMKGLWVWRTPRSSMGLAMMVALVFGVLLLCSGISTAQTASPPAPPNDYFADSQLISGSTASVDGTTQSATREDPSEPDHYTFNLDDAGEWLGDHSVWYSWKAPHSGSTTIDTCQANIDSILAVYTGSELSNLSRVTDNNNDFCGGGWGSKVTFDASAGTTYRIVVGDAGGLRESTFTLKLYNASSTRYTIKDLGTLPGGSFSRAFDINVSGQVVGQADTSTGQYHAFLYSGGQMQDLGTLGGSSSGANGINDSGQVAGGSGTSTGDARAFLYSGGQMRDLGTFGRDTAAADINNSGQVVGQSMVSNETCSGCYHAFLYSDGQMQDLGTLPGSYDSTANAVNDSGQVAGWATIPRGTATSTHAIFYSDGQMRDLGALPGGDFSVAEGINSSGQVVGYSNTATSTHAFLYSDGQMQDLGTLPGGSASWASGVNDSGQVVGGANTSPGTFRAFVYSGAQMRDLNELIPSGSGWELTHAWAINTSGQIVGEGHINGQDRERAFLATPTQTPRVTSTSPTANATAVDPATNVTATFSEEMMASSINSTTFKLSVIRKGSHTKGVAASVRYDAATHTATLDPTHSLQRGESYNAVVSTGAKDLEGNPLEQQHSWSFTVRK